jgi:zinc/manganese transport system substrate-binding protein
VRAPVLLLPVLLAGVLAGCAPQTSPADDGVVRIVASTNVYGDLARSIAGDDAEVTSIIEDPAQDPHQFEANGRIALALSRADIVIVNGGGYDGFVRQLLDAGGNTGARVIDAVELSGYDAGAPGFNEHVWYDYATVTTVVKAIGAALGIADPADAALYDGRVDGLVASLTALGQLEATISAAASGAGVVITEPVPLYALENAGLVNLTPPEFSEAIEEDTDIPPALLQQVLNLIGDGSARVVVYNAQTAGPQTSAVIDVATEQRVPLVGVTETLPEGEDYLSWQTGFLTDILKAVTS